MSLVDRIKVLCDSKDLTLIGLEREIDLGRGTIRKWDESSPSVEKLQKVAAYFNVSTDYLLGKESPPPSPRYIDVPIDPETLKIMCRIPLLSKNNKAIISDMIESMIKNQE
jgi:transcriptional regulator with XRE-family HTH domain